MRELTLRAFTSQDIPVWQGWGRKREMAPLDPALLPTFGLIVPGVAVGFLFQTDSRLAFVEGFLSNPDAPLFVRARAHHLILSQLVERAKHAGFRTVVGFTGKSGPVKLCIRQGFRRLGDYTMMLKEVQ